jgi:hypothetical protein
MLTTSISSRRIPARFAALIGAVLVTLAVAAPSALAVHYEEVPELPGGGGCVSIAQPNPPVKPGAPLQPHSDSGCPSTNLPGTP